MFRVSCKALLITSACVVAAAKLHAHAGSSPVAATQDINRCLFVVRAAAAAKMLEDDTTSRSRRVGMVER